MCCKEKCAKHTHKLVGYIVDLLMVVYTVVFCSRVHTTLIVAYGVQSTLLNIFGGYSTPQIKGAQIRHGVIHKAFSYCGLQNAREWNDKLT